MSELLEIIMVVCFGASWPFNVIKSYRSRTAKGKSLTFLLLIFAGYTCGIISKLVSPAYKWYVLFFYVLNLIMVGTDLILYFRNRKIDQMTHS
ncbi:MAG TPA: hypothetical protein GX505_06180 [Clostridiales bacterium]|nr:hypothetical protein [Clostridiales bacterium]